MKWSVENGECMKEGESRKAESSQTFLNLFLSILCYSVVLQNDLKELAR